MGVNKLEGYFKGVPVYSNPDVAKDTLYVINTENFTMENEVKEMAKESLEETKDELIDHVEKNSKDQYTIEEFKDLYRRWMKGNTPSPFSEVFTFIDWLEQGPSKEKRKEEDAVMQGYAMSLLRPTK